MKLIKDSDGYYIDKTGKIYKNNLLVGTWISKQGYENINIRLNGEFKIKQVHRLVAETFIENPYNKEFVNHLDGVKSNNVVNNLEWCTREENIKHAYDIGLFNNNKEIICLETKETFRSIGAASKHLGCSKSGISFVLCGKYKQCNGYTFAVIEDNRILYPNYIIPKPINSKIIYCITNNKAYKSIECASKELSIYRGTIRKVLKGEQKSCKGYEFQYTTR